MDYYRPNRTGYTTIPVLEFLQGSEWNDRCLDFIHAVRPTDIRIALPHDVVNDNAVVWRVTVHLTDDNHVRKIEQEVEVGLRTADNGHCLINNIPRGTWPRHGEAGIVVRLGRKHQL